MFVSSIFGRKLKRESIEKALEYLAEWAASQQIVIGDVTFEKHLLLSHVSCPHGLTFKSCIFNEGICIADSDMMSFEVVGGVVKSKFEVRNVKTEKHLVKFKSLLIAPNVEFKFSHDGERFPLHVIFEELRHSPTRVLAHELGHLTGEGDDGPDSMSNINKFENPIMTPIDGLVRTAY